MSKLHVAEKKRHIERSLRAEGASKQQARKAVSSVSAAREVDTMSAALFLKLARQAVARDMAENQRGPENADR